MAPERLVPERTTSPSEAAPSVPWMSRRKWGGRARRERSCQEGHRRGSGAGGGRGRGLLGAPGPGGAGGCRRIALSTRRMRGVGFDCSGADRRFRDRRVGVGSVGAGAGAARRVAGSVRGGGTDGEGYSFRSNLNWGASGHPSLASDSTIFLKVCDSAPAEWSLRVTAAAKPHS